MDMTNVFDQVANAISEFYFDKVDINRVTKTTDSDGSVSFSLPTEPVIPQVSCSISYKQIDNPNPEEVGKSPLVSVLQIFLDNSLDVRKGDTITAYKYDSNKTTVLGTYEGICNEPIKYPTHQQIEIILKGNA